MRILQCALVLLFAVAAGLPADLARAEDTASPDEGAYVAWAVRHDTSPPLTEMVARAAERGPALPTGLRTEVPLHLPPHLQALQSRPRPDEPDPLLVRDRALPGPSAPTPDPSLVFNGGSDDQNEQVLGFRIVPPDTEGDVGPDHYVQWINLIVTIFDKQGDVVEGPFAGNAFWDGFGGVCETTNSGDPLVLYDHRANRWVVSQFAVEDGGGFTGIECVALSTGPNPTGSYHRYAFLVAGPTQLPDYPKMGLWSDSYGLAIDVFDQTGFFDTASACALERTPMLSGQAARLVCRDFPCSGSQCPFGVLPADLEGSPAPANGAPIPFFSYWDREVDGSGFNDGVRVWNLNVNWSDPGGTTLTNPASLSGAAFDRNLCGFNRACIPQPSPGERLDPLSFKTMWRAHYRREGGFDSVLLNTTVNVGSDRAGIRWAELRKTGSSWAFFQEGTHSPGSLHRWMGSIAKDDQGNICLGYSASSTSSFPSVRYTCRSPGDPPGTLPGGEVVMRAGSGAQTNSLNRWGDYSSLSVDADGCTFWYTQEYYQTTGDFDFNSSIGAFAFPDCGGGQDRTLTVTKAGSGTGTVTSDPPGIACGATCVAIFPNGTVVDLTATPDPGSVFGGWTGAADCSDGRVTMNADLTCTATFTRTFTLTVTKGGLGTGTVTSEPAGIDCGTDCTQSFAEGTAVSLLPIPDYGFEFDGWAGHADCEDGSLTMTGNRTCQAFFGDCDQLSIFQVPPQMVGGTQTFEACNELLAGQGGFVVLSTGDVTLRAGNRVVLQPGFEVRDGGELRVVIGPDVP